jgi:hypothetical protein
MFRAIELAAATAGIWTAMWVGLLWLT